MYEHFLCAGTEATKRNMAAVTEQSCKKSKLEGVDDVFEIFFSKYGQFNAFIRAYRSLLESVKHSLLPAVINSCNAHVSNRQGKFSSCNCEAAADSNQPFQFGAFFGKGVDIFNCLKQKKVPEVGPLKTVTEKLLKYILSQEWHHELKKIEQRTYVTGETQVMVTLAEHFFSKLSVPQEYVMDQHSKRSTICKCGKCKLENLKFDDTSIGHHQVWHGALDIVFESCGFAIAVNEEDNEDNISPGSCSPGEVKLENLDNVQPRSQVIAQTIVFSLLQKQRHPLSPHFMTPNIVANASCMKFFFYDAEHDILLESKKYQFLWYILPVQLVFETVIASWLELNHKVLCTDTFAECIANAPKSKFRELAGDAISIYDCDLKYRNIFQGEQPPMPFSQWDYFEVKHGDTFRWPSSLTFNCDI